MTYQPHRDVTAMREIYNKKVKPLIEDGNYPLAAIEMHNVNLLPIMLKSALEIRATTHFGDNMLNCGELLGRALYEGDDDKIKSHMKFFESYAAQTTLPGGSLEDI